MPGDRCRPRRAGHGSPHPRCHGPAGAAAGPPADGVLAGLAHRPRLLRGRLPGDDLRRPPPRASATTTSRASGWPSGGRRWRRSSSPSAPSRAPILSFEMGLLWPELMGPYGDVIGLPFAIEGIAFFIEAIFLGIYLYGWGRMPPAVAPGACSSRSPCAGVVGTFCVLAVNAWMNDPAGFRLVDGEVTDVDPLARRCSTTASWLAVRSTCGWRVHARRASSSAASTPPGCSGAATTATTGSASRCRSCSPRVAALVQPFIGHLLGAPAARPASPPSSRPSSWPSRPRPGRRCGIGGLLIDGEVRFGDRDPACSAPLHRPQLVRPARCPASTSSPTTSGPPTQPHPPGVPGDGGPRHCC